jgi:HK97 family phage prohead protease
VSDTIDLIDDEEIDAPSGVPVDNLTRFAEFRAEPSDDGLTLDGYGAVFNAETLIDSWEGMFVERIAPGAFKRSLGQRTPILQFDHGQHPLIGSLPIGTIRSIREDSHGLKVRARLADNWLIQPVRDAIRDGAITGMSFRFRVVDDAWSTRDGQKVRTIKQVELYEVGPVVFPAYEQTTVGVRSRQALTALQDPEVRAEIAQLLASGTDLRSLADVDASPDVARVDLATDPAGGHSEHTTKTARARALLAFA